MANLHVLHMTGTQVFSVLVTQITFHIIIILLVSRTVELLLTLPLLVFAGVFLRYLWAKSPSLRQKASSKMGSVGVTLTPEGSMQAAQYNVVRNI